LKNSLPCQENFAKMKSLLIAFAPLFLFPAFSLAQNLVPNPSFEEHDSCPDQFGQICFANSWESFSDGSEEYFNSCDLTNYFSVPHNFEGYQIAFDGQAYVGLNFYNPFASNQREAIGCKLNDTLIIGHRYYISFYVNLSDNSTIAINNIGLLFSTKTYNTSYCNSTYWNLISNFSHYNCQQVIADTVNWIKLQGSFIADSLYNYLILSNFFMDQNTTVDTLNPSFVQGPFYYVDLVCVSEDSTICDWQSGYQSLSSDTFDLEIFPNPTDDFINIKINDLFTGNLKCIFYDLLGREKKQSTMEKAGKIYISDLSNGLYILQITDGKMNRKNIKVIINKQKK
jgi:hypothetical protein